MGVRPGQPIVYLCLSKLIEINKQSGVRPVGVGEMWLCLFAKIVFKVTGLEATMACQDDHLCAVLKAVIGLSTKEWYFLLVDAKNALNEID